MRGAIRLWLSGFLLAAGFCLATAPASAEGWRDGTPMTTARAFAGAALLGDDLYVVGGDSTAGPRNVAEIYDIRGNIWRAAVALPVGLQHFGMAQLNGRLYIAGGHEAPVQSRIGSTALFGESASPDVPANGGDTANVWVFDPNIGSWLSGPSMPAARAGHGLVAVDGKLYALGGRGEGASRVFVYDPARDRWSVSGSPMPSPRVAAAYAVADGLIYAIGGLNGGAASARVDIFNPSNGSWRSGSSLPEPRAGHVAAVLDGRLHVTGGEQRRPLRTYGDHFVLDLAGTAWQRATSMPTPRHGAVAAATGGRFIVVGGSPGAGVYTVFTESDMVDIYTE
ncbi:MAG: kelch repeat-containing protein [Parvibaculum sp.]|uniref:Kelch repeat-containing protein n=1 Tax=Parvibaculum sp. TaxID=2024848 RepID=UPI0034A017FC